VREGRVPYGCSYPDPTDNVSAAIHFPRPNCILPSPLHNTPSTPSRQHSLSSPFLNASRGSPSPLTPAQPIRERSVVPKSSPCDGSDSQGDWWVVMTGTEPGVYYGRWVVSRSQFISYINLFRAAAERAMGHLANPTSVRTNSQSAADRLFVNAYCSRQVARLV
jgi:hypothetical protein